MKSYSQLFSRSVQGSKMTARGNIVVLKFELCHVHVDAYFIYARLTRARKHFTCVCNTTSLTKKNSILMSIDGEPQTRKLRGRTISVDQNEP